MNTNRNTARIVLVAALFMAFSLACSSIPFLGDDPDPTSMPTPTPTPSEVVLPVTSGEESEEQNDETETPDEEPVETEEKGEPELLTGPEGQTLDPCLIGIWAVDHESMSNYLTTAMNQTEEVLFSVSQISGNLFMIFDENGVMGADSEDFQIIMTFNTGVEGVGFEFTYLIEAEGTAQYSADGSSVTNWDHDYTFASDPLSAFGEISSNGDTYVINVTPDWFVSANPGGGEDATGTYNCSGDTLSFMPNEYGPIVFLRVE